MWWKILAGVVVIALAGLFLLTFGNAKYQSGELAERVKWKDVSLQHQKDMEKLELENAGRLTAAAETYADRLAATQPIVLHDKETVDHYAQTDAGRVLCLKPDRLLGIEQDRATNFPGYFITASESDRTVRSNTIVDK